MRPRTQVVRERILDAALRLLGTKGGGTIAQPRVAREAGIPQGHLTYYFPKRLDLLAAVTARFVDGLREELPGLGSETRASIDAAGRKGALRFIRKLVKDRARTRSLLGLLIATEDEPALHRQMSRHVETLRLLVAKLVGKPASDPDVDLALATLWGIGLLHLVIDGHSDADMDRLLSRFAARLEEDHIEVGDEDLLRPQ